MAGDRWTCTPEGTRTLGVATLMGLPPGSWAIWGSVPMIFSSSDESDKVGDLLLLDMTHFLKRKFFSSLLDRR